MPTLPEINSHKTHGPFLPYNYPTFQHTIGNSMHTNNPTCIRILSACPRHWQWEHLIHYAQTTENTSLNPFLDVAGYIRHEIFILWCHFLQCCLFFFLFLFFVCFEITSASAQRAGQREVGGYTTGCRWHGSAVEIPLLALVVFVYVSECNIH